MSTNISPLPATPKASFFARTRKALAGGLAGGATAGGTALVTAFQDGSFNVGDGWTVAGAFVGGFIVAAAAVYSTTNAPGQ